MTGYQLSAVVMVKIIMNYVVYYVFFLPFSSEIFVCCINIMRNYAFMYHIVPEANTHRRP